MTRPHPGSHLRRVALCLCGLLASVPASGADERTLVFYHTHTGKRLEILYSNNGRYLPSALEQAQRFLGDFRNGESRAIDPALLDLLFDIRESLGSRGAYEVISAYRSPETNEMLRARSSGVAGNSLHLVGKAIDVRLDDVELARLRDAAIALQRGGVGYYEASDFVHIDTGRVRRW